MVLDHGDESVPFVEDKMNLTKAFLRLVPGSSKWPLQRLSDLHLGNQRVTLKKLAVDLCSDCWGEMEILIPNNGTKYDPILIGGVEESDFSKR